MSSVPGPAPAALTRAFRMLVVCDGRPERIFLERVLRQPGYEAVFASEGYEALRIAEARGPFDLLVTDVDIPGMGGHELARRIRAVEPSVKILYLANETDELFEERTALWEEEAFLEKPLTAQSVLEAVSLILVGHIPPPRPVRVNVPGTRVRFEDRVADLVRFSVTGALVQDSDPRAVGSVWQIGLVFPSETIELGGRVVSCERLAPAPRDASTPQRPFAIALAFIDVSPPAGRALQRIVQQAAQAKQSRSLPRGPIKL